MEGSNVDSYTGICCRSSSFDLVRPDAKWPSSSAGSWCQLQLTRAKGCQPRRIQNARKQ